MSKAYIFFFVVGVCFAPATLQSSTLLRVSDTVAHSSADTAAKHTIRFENGRAVPASGKIIITPAEGQFTIPSGFGASDMELRVNGESKTLAASAGMGSGSAVGVSAVIGSSGSITYTLNDTNPIAATSSIVITLGAGSRKIQNPAATGSYQVVIETKTADGVVLDSADAMVAILSPVAVNASKKAPLQRPPPPPPPQLLDTSGEGSAPSTPAPVQPAPLLPAPIKAPPSGEEYLPSPEREKVVEAACVFHIFTQPLRSGARGQEVLQMQLVLQQLELYPWYIEPRGVFDQQTQTALKKYQRENQLAASGVLDAGTIARLNQRRRIHAVQRGTAPRYAFARGLARGSRDPDVKQLQRTLRALGYYPAVAQISGYFAWVTEYAVKNFQCDHAIIPDGIVRNATQAALNALTVPPAVRPSVPEQFPPTIERPSIERKAPSKTVPPASKPAPPKIQPPPTIRQKVLDFFRNLFK